MDRVIAVTGAFGVLGDATVRALVAAGYRVALIDVADDDKAHIDGLEADKILVVGTVDLTDEASTCAAMERIEKHFGRLDGLVNIAGGFVWVPMADADANQWQQMFDMNVKTTVNASRAALKAIEASPAGRIINIGAAGALKADMGMGPYAASKAGVMRFTESLAVEMKATNVTVNAILPSIIDTPRNRADMPDADVNTWVSPHDLAAFILHLLSKEGGAIHGALLPVTGRV